MNYTVLLQKYGWKFFSQCTCQGTYFEKFDNQARFPGWEIWVAPDLQVFRVFNGKKENLADDRSVTQLERTITLNKLY